MQEAYVSKRRQARFRSERKGRSDEQCRRPPPRARREGAAASTLSFWSLPRMRQRRCQIDADTGRAEPRFASPAVLQAAPDRDLLSAEGKDTRFVALRGSGCSGPRSAVIVLHQRG